MSTAAKSAYNTILKWNAVEVAELISISGPAQKAKAIDVTNMDSPSSFAEKIIGIVDGGQITVEGNWTSVAGQTAVNTDMQARTQRTLVITQPDTHTFTCTAFCVDLATDYKVQDRMTFKATFEITGEPTFA